MVVRQIHKLQKLGASRRPNSRLLAIGSIMHFSRPGDRVWGTGINGKALAAMENLPSDLHVSAVRGPLTRAELMNRGVACPEVYGDPAVLLPTVFPELERLAQAKELDVSIVPNMHDYQRTLREFGDRFNIINPCSDVGTVLEQIAISRNVLASSLHGIIVAQALGIATRLVKSETEPDFKYRDHYLGIGASPAHPAESIRDGLISGFEPAPDIDGTKLLESFPHDLWTAP